MQCTSGNEWTGKNRSWAVLKRQSILKSNSHLGEVSIFLFILKISISFSNFLRLSLFCEMFADGNIHVCFRRLMQSHEFRLEGFLAFALSHQPYLGGAICATEFLRKLRFSFLTCQLTSPHQLATSELDDRYVGESIPEVFGMDGPALEL